MSGLRQLGRDSLFYGVLDVANRFVVVFLIPLYTRVLAPADYGALDLVLMLMAMVIAMLSLGLDTAFLHRFNATDSTAERREVVTSTMVTAIGIVTVGALLLILFRGPLAAATLPAVDGADRLLLLALLALPLQTVTQMQLLLLRARFAFRKYAALSLGMLLLTLGLNFLFVLVLGWGIEGVLLAQLLARLPAIVYGFIATGHEYGRHFSPQLSGALLRYGAPLVVGNVTYWALLYMERYALAGFDSLAQLGIYAIAARIATAMTVVTMAIDVAWTPFAYSVQRRPEASAVYARALTYYLVAACTAGLLISVFARELLVLLATPDYYPAYVLVGPVAAALVLRGVINIVAIGAMVTERTRIIAEASCFSLVAGAVLLVLLVPLLGALGAALATVGARGLVVLVLYLRTRKPYPIPWDWSRIARLALVATVVTCVAVALGQLDLWPGFLLKVLVLLPAGAALALFLRVLEPAELRTLTDMARARAPGLRGAV